jgi:hypothetical protein
MLAYARASGLVCVVKIYPIDVILYLLKLLYFLRLKILILKMSK